MWVKGELFDDFDTVAASAQDRLDRTHQPYLFDRLTWFRMLWQHCPPGEFPLIARTRAENCDAWLFLANVDGRNAVGLGNWYTLSYRPVFTTQTTDATKTALLTALARRLGSGPSRLSSIMLSPVPQHDGSVDIILKAFRRGGWYAVSHPKTANWTVNVAGKSFDDYWAERPGQVRSTHDRKLKKSGVTVDIYTEFDADAWAEYEDIYGESWKGEEGSPEFLRAMFEYEGNAGALRLGIARIDGRAIAAQLWTVEGGSAIIHKLAYREDAAELSPGTILTTAMFRHVISKDKVALIDYGTGDDSYKADWMDTRNILEEIELYNVKTISGLFGALKAMMKGIFKKSELV
jgi:hypothetical protein